jgi:hypothetical protein
MEEMTAAWAIETEASCTATAPGAINAADKAAAEAAFNKLDTAFIGLNYLFSKSPRRENRSARCFPVSS